MTEFLPNVCSVTQRCNQYVTLSSFKKSVTVCRTWAGTLIHITGYPSPSIPKHLPTLAASSPPCLIAETLKSMLYSMPRVPGTASSGTNVSISINDKNSSSRQTKRRRGTPRDDKRIGTFHAFYLKLDDGCNLYIRGRFICFWDKIWPIFPADNLGIWVLIFFFNL